MRNQQNDELKKSRKINNTKIRFCQKVYTSDKSLARHQNFKKGNEIQIKKYRMNKK